MVFTQENLLWEFTDWRYPHQTSPLSLNTSPHCHAAESWFILLCIPVFVMTVEQGAENSIEKKSLLL
jgi:hypothetical protein